MQNAEYFRPTPALLVAGLLAGGLLLTQSASAVLPESPPAQATVPQTTSTPAAGAATTQPKVSPYARVNRERTQASMAAGARTPRQVVPNVVPNATPAAARKPASGGARKN